MSGKFKRTMESLSGAQIPSLDQWRARMLHIFDYASEKKDKSWLKLYPPFIHGIYFMPQISFFFARNFHDTKHDYLHQPNQHRPKTIVHRASARPNPGPSIGPTLSCTRHRSDPILEQVSAHRNLAPGIGPTRSCKRHRPNPILH